ncbi:hypothetical protein [Halegenticoccus tardaugens]|uniref:hypothetical protein n=1 Tax=Halegenticoccus tardaugens TaxID=2071624 RepID=UPI001E2FBDBB|nr:hypothetical protein [Halegenticoccus tardaugens]
MNVTDVLKTGASRSVERNGLFLMGIVFVLSAVNGLLGFGIARWAAEQGGGTAAPQSDPAILLAVGLAGLLSLAIGVATIVVSIAAIRVFVSDETERLPREYFTRNVGWATLNFIVGAIVFGIVVALGFVALILPGIFLLVTLAFWSVYVAVEDQNFVRGFRSSWALTRGYRLDLVLLGVAVLLVTLALNVVFGVGNLAGAGVGLVFAQIGSAIATVFSTAVLATAYNELTARSAEEEGTIPSSRGATPADDAAESV